MGRCVGGMLALQVTVLLHLRLQLPRQAIAPRLDPSAMWAATAVMEAAQVKERTPTLASNEELATRRAP